MPSPIDRDEEDWEREDITPRTISSSNGPSRVMINPVRLAAPVAPVLAPSADDDDEWDRGLARKSAGPAASGWEQNRRIWQEANSPAPLIFSQQQFPALSALSGPPSSSASSSRQSSTSSSSSTAPTPKITLLRRPTQDTYGGGAGGGSTRAGILTTSDASRRTFSEREEEYRKARERIFAGTSTADGADVSGASSGSGNGSGSGRSGRGSRGSSPRVVSDEQVQRQPSGPDGSGGFGGTGRGRDPSRGGGGGRGGRP